MSFGKEQTVARMSGCAECGEPVLDDDHADQTCEGCGEVFCGKCIDEHVDGCEAFQELLDRDHVEDLNAARGRRGMGPITSGTVTR